MLFNAILIILIYSTISFASETAVTESGKQVVLNDNGTWNYADKSKSSTNANSAIGVVNKYLQATSWQERLDYVNNRSKVEPIMEKHYGNSVFNTNEYRVLTSKEPSNVKIGQVVKIKAALNKNNSSTYYVVKTSKGYKVDWETSAGYNKVSVAEFKANKSDKSVTFRGICRLYSGGLDLNKSISDSYYTIFIDTNKGDIGPAYLSKSTKEGKKLYNILKDGNEHDVVIDLCWKETNMTGDPSYYIKEDKVFVTKIHNIDSWEE